MTPTRQAVARIRSLGPLTVNGHTVLLRRPQFADADRWREIRLRDRNLIEPFTPSSPIPWAERHSRAYWIRECIALAKAQRAGQTYQFAIDVDGRFAGQCALTWSQANGDAPEISIWMDPQIALSGTATLSTAMLLDSAFDRLGVARIVAGTGTDNKPASLRAERFGLVKEATMRSYFDAGSERKDYYLWSLTRAEVPAGGFVAKALGVRTTLPVHEQLVEIPRHMMPLSTLVVGARTLADVYLASFRHSMFQRFALAPNMSAGPVSTPAGTLALGTSASLVRRTAAAARRSLRRYAAPRWDLDLTLDETSVGMCRFSSIYNRSAEVEVALSNTSIAAEIAEQASVLAVTCAFEAGFLRVWQAIPVGDTTAAQRASAAGMTKEGIMRQFRSIGGVRRDFELWASVGDTAAA